jgi:phosphatidylserine/phosphatidylglycerophosphate/cardiolipin synthase-like enzyme
MSIIKHILDEELRRLQKLSKKYRHEIDGLPKGSLSRKRRGDNYYYYLAFRNGAKVKFIYVGKDSSQAVKAALAARRKRIQNLELLKKIKLDMQELKKALYGRRG